jgi:uncharacterized protein (TIGR03118 family)
MQQIRSWSARLAALVLLAAVISPISLADDQDHYKQTNLVSDVPGTAATTDPDLVNPFGLVHGPTSPWWVADEGAGLSTLYNGAGTKQALVVTIPPPAGSAAGTKATPTGIVSNGSSGVFLVGTSPAPARFIFSTLDGTISAWGPALGTQAALVVDNSGKAIYTGLAIASAGGQTMLYAANHMTGKIDVFDSSFHPATVSGSFVDMAVPAGLVVFNIQNVGGDLFVTYADPATPPAFGRGLGFVDRFDANGNLLMRLETGKWLNAPWGLAMAPANFGKFSNMLLVGNLGSGQIAGYDPASGEFQGLLHAASGGALSIDGLWGLGFGSGVANNGPTNTLFFTAGIQNLKHGLFGTLTVVPSDDQQQNEVNEQNENENEANPPIL